MAKPMQYTKRGGFVYLAILRTHGNDNVLFKYGMTRRCPYARVRQVCTASGYDMLVFDSIPSLDAFNDEKMVWSLLKPLSKNNFGEFFYTNFPDIVTDIFINLRDFRLAEWRNFVRSSHALLQA